MIHYWSCSKVIGIYQCFNGSLNAYLKKCLEIIALLDDFTIQHVSKDKNTTTNILAQQASSFRSNQGKLYVLKQLMVWFSSNAGC
jgi:hypothetical protein